MKRLTYFLAAAVVLAATACGSTSTSGQTGIARPPAHSPSPRAPATNGVSRMTPAQATHAAVAALAAAHSVRIRGTSSSEGKPMYLDLRLTDAGGIGTVSYHGSSLQMIVNGGDYYMMGSAQAWKATGSPDTAAALLAGRWVKVPSSYQSQEETFTLSALTHQMAHQAPVAGVVSPAVLGGRDVVVIKYADGARLYIARTGSPCPLRYTTTGSGGGQLDFSEYGVPVHVTPPKGAIDMTMG